MFTFVLGNVLGRSAAVSFRRKLARDGDPDELLRDSMAQAAEVAERFPRLRTRLDSAAAKYAASPTDTFEYGLTTILDGLQTRLDAP